MNLLSGSTWKGAKLRFGEAKPDFRERLRNFLFFIATLADCHNNQNSFLSVGLHSRTRQQPKGHPKNEENGMKVHKQKT